MIIRHIIITSLTGLLANKSRSALTTLGIIIGITSLILIMSVGQGAEDLILNQIAGLGSKTLIIEPGREPKGPTDFVQLLSNSLKKKDLELLKNPANVRGLGDITPIVVYVGTVSYGNETKRTAVRGASDLITKIHDVYPSQGSFFNDDDIKQLTRVAVIGSRVTEELFAFSNPIGEKIKINNISFRIVGVFPEKGEGGIFEIDDMVFVPYTTAQKYLTGTDYYNAILAQAQSEEIIPMVVQDIEYTLRESHNITNPEKDDFHVHTQVDIAQRIGIVADILTILLVSLGAISLLVGGIGIMNIMLVSVTERTKEIGLRKAVGATNGDILIQFLVEAIILTSVGGFIGILLGTLLSFIASVILSTIVKLIWTFHFPYAAMLIGIMVSASVGLLFGIYPARQASLKSPIEALQYE